VDNAEVLGALVEALVTLAGQLPLVFAVHPRTRARLEEFGLLQRLDAAKGMHLSEPMGYIRFMALVCDCRLVITDSGGIQEETTYLGIPCLTLRNTTERPVTVSNGSNRLVTPVDLADHAARALKGDWPTGQCPDLWDGDTASRVVADIEKRFG
jgi:UDP-N-acetylglucosamine 2-epimerase (non-hydrolysing)